jgi:hypothetical protein
VAAFAFLIIGLLCAIVSRILLLIAALDVSVWWAFGVFLPFGPLFFRLSYPDLARSSRLFRLATLPCLFLYLLLGPGPSYRRQLSNGKLTSSLSSYYGLESLRAGGKKSPSPTPSIEQQIAERRTANYREFQRLESWSAALKLRKRDLLHSDSEGNRLYEIELGQYNAALAKAKAEREALARATAAK